MSVSHATVRTITKIEESLLGVRAEQILQLLPGVCLAALLAWISEWMSGFVGHTVMGFTRSPLSAVTVAILLGLLVGNLIPMPGWLLPGFGFSVKKLLRLGIILLGIRLSLFDLFRLGLMGIPIVLICIVSAMIITHWLNQRLSLPARLGTLIGVGTSICGVSAIVATGPAIEAREEEIAYAVAVITLFGIVATLVYPYFAYMIFAGDPIYAGLFLGTAIHDTSQVTGAGLVFADLFQAPRALDVATVTKLVRNVSMAAIIPFMAIRHVKHTANQTTSSRTSFARLFPLFVLGFVLLAAIRTLGDAGIHGMTLLGGAETNGSAFGLWDAAMWKSIHATVTSWASYLLTVALAAVGLSTRFATLRGLGIKPFLVGLGAALSVGVVSAGTILIMGALIAL